MQHISTLNMSFVLYHGTWVCWGGWGVSAPAPPVHWLLKIRTHGLNVCVLYPNFGMSHCSWLWSQLTRAKYNNHRC